MGLKEKPKDGLLIFITTTNGKSCNQIYCFRRMKVLDFRYDGFRSGHQ